MKMYFFKFSLMALMLAIVLSFTGCSKSDDGPVYKDGCFKYDDKTYNSLNAAIRAAMNNQDDTENIIYLLDDVLDNEPLSISDNECDKVTFDLGKFTYVSANGLDFKCVQLYLSGEGCFECRSGALSSVSRIEVDEDFNGQISAPVILNDAVMAVFSPKATVNISQLQFDKNGIFTMEVVSEKPASVVIDRLSASGGSKVCAIDGESVVIKEGGKVHVHNYKLVDDVPANCLNAGYKAYKCEDCGEDYLDFNEGELGSCIVGGLIHHAAVEPTDTTSGNLEYWECPDCGATYSDAEGKNSFYPTLLAKNYDLPLEILFGLDGAMEQQYNAIDWADHLVGFGFDLLGSLISSSFTSDDDELMKISNKIDQLSKDVAEIRSAIDQLFKQLDNVTIKNVLIGYSGNIKELSDITDKYYVQYMKYLKDNTMPAEEKKAKIDELLERFDEVMKTGGGLDTKLLGLLEYYLSNPSTMTQGDFKNIPDAQARYTRNIYLWEHMGYNLRKCATVADFHRLASSYTMINVYLQWTQHPEDKGQMEKLKTTLEKCQETWKNDVNDMNTRNDKYRIFCGGKPGELVYYEKEYCYLGIGLQLWFENKDNTEKYYFPAYDGGKNVAMASFNTLLKNVGLEKGFIEHLHMTATYEKFKDKIGENTTNALLKFIGFPDKKPYESRLLCEGNGCSWYNYGHLNDSQWYPHYKIFQWYKHAGYSAYFRAKTNLTWKAPNELTEFDIRANVGMYADGGKIYNPGIHYGYSFLTIRKTDVK